MDLLLDINVAVDSCTGRKPWCATADLAIIKCQFSGGRLWLYTGSVQTLEYVTRKELKRMAAEQARNLSDKQLEEQTRELLHAFVADKHWLSALAGEGPVFKAQDPEGERLLRAMDRFLSGRIKLLTRDERLLANHP